MGYRFKLIVGVWEGSKAQRVVWFVLYCFLCSWRSPLLDWCFRFVSIMVILASIGCDVRVIAFFVASLSRNALSQGVPDRIVFFRLSIIARVCIAGFREKAVLIDMVCPVGPVLSLTCVLLNCQCSNVIRISTWKCIGAESILCLGE